MIPLITVPLGKDLVSKYEYPFGEIQFNLSKDSTETYEDLKSGWSFSVGCKNTLAIHKVFKMEKSKILDYISKDIDFMNIVSSFIGVLVDNIRPSILYYLDYGQILFPNNPTGSELIISWFQIPEEERRIDRLYFSVL